jgi:predicted DNA-binding protein with PD1-like motif
MKQHMFRLKRGNDLLLEIDEYALKHNILAGVIVSCVGCLTKATVRSADGLTIKEINEEVEIVSITGTISKNGSHIHISVSNDSLATFGGHLKPGCLVNTTAEIVIIELSNVAFEREFDEVTGYEELVFKKIAKKK